jgi:4-hydroxybutyryl-CoA dehydratase/vinylacetyl-CoA-Delta-isomerase
MNPEEKPYLERFLAGKDGIPTEHRLRAVRLAKDMVGHGHDGAFIHTEGSLAAQKMAIYAAADWDRYKAIAKRTAGIPGWKENSDLKELPDWPPELVI